MQRAASAFSRLCRHRRPQQVAGAVRREEGFMLIELLVVIGLLALVMGLLMNPIILSTRIQKRDANYAFSQQEVQVGLESMVNEIRQAETSPNVSNPEPTSNVADMEVSHQGTQYEVKYDCTVVQPLPARTTLPVGTTECVRYAAASGISLPTTGSGCTASEPSGVTCKIVLMNLLNQVTSSQQPTSTPVFTWAPTASAPYYMQETVDVPSSDGQYYGLKHSIVLSDGALMRNLNVGN
jgi:type II secretory pathway pseudopilin PulG